MSRLDSPPTNPTLEERVLSLGDRLTDKQRGLARLLLDDELWVAFASADEIGQRAGVDAATVVRFSRLLGYEGYADLRDAVRRSVPELLTAIEKVSGAVGLQGSTGDVVDDVIAQDIRNIEETARRNSSESLSAAITSISRARRVLLIASGVAPYLADHLAHQLSLAGVQTHPVPRTVTEGSAAIASLGNRDVLIAIGFWRYIRETVSLFKCACASDAATISITDNKLSPFASADVVLFAATSTPQLTHSLTAALCLANTLATGLALAKPERTIGHLRSIERIYEAVEALE